MRVINDAAGLQALHGCVLVPTMGALHEGHRALVRRAVEERSVIPGRPPVVVTIFVNPTQFNDPADLARYPRTLDQDVAVCTRAGADAVFAPTPETVYPPGQVISTPALPDVAIKPGLEDAHRPGHFAGVCQVVKRLFDLTRPAAALFGEKDWQQLQVITAMVARERLPVRIIPAPTVREPDGLAMSSRNVFLSRAERRTAVGIIEALRAAGREPTPGDAEQRMRGLLSDGGFAIDYAVVRHARTLMPVREAGTDGLTRALIAARLGSVRLIDNAPWPA